MKIKERIKNGGFWVSMISSVFLILGAFGIEIADETGNSIINAVCSALVVLGIISDPTAGKGYLDAIKLDASAPVDVSAEIALASAATEKRVDVEADETPEHGKDAAVEEVKSPNTKSKCSKG